MTNIDRPIPARSLHAFANQLCLHMESVDADTVAAIIAVRRRNLLVPVSIPHGGPDPVGEIDQLTAGQHRVAAMVTQIGWTPVSALPTQRAWASVIVGRGQPVLALLRRVDCPGTAWTQVPPHHLPWVLLSTSGAMRRIVSSDPGTRVPLRLRLGTAAGLFRTPDDEPHPPVDDQGML